jgi:hypothetical protein
VRAAASRRPRLAQTGWSTIWMLTAEQSCKMRTNMNKQTSCKAFCCRQPPGRAGLDREHAAALPPKA